MPFKSKVQYVPDHMKQAIGVEFSKIANKIFTPNNTPPIPTAIVAKREIDAALQEKMQGMTPVEYRNHLTEKNKGILQRTTTAAKVG